MGLVAIRVTSFRVLRVVAFSIDAIVFVKYFSLLLDWPLKGGEA